MDNVHPQDLPTFLDPLLDYLADHLPAPIYDTLFTVFSYGLLLASGAFSLLTTLPSWKPWEWDAQKVLPPLISVLAAYYTLLSIYRTTGWMVRTAFWVVKWTVIAGILGASFGWLSANGDGQNGLSSIFGSLQNQEGARRTGRSGARSRNGRPRPWEFFEAHQQWQYNERDQHQAQEQNAVSNVLQYIAGIAGRAMGGRAYEVIDGVKHILDVAQGEGNGNEGGQERSGAQQPSREQPKRKGKAAARQGGTRSR